jgi:hypothetical protein
MGGVERLAGPEDLNTDSCPEKVLKAEIQYHVMLESSNEISKQVSQQKRSLIL